MIDTRTAVAVLLKLQKSFTSVFRLIGVYEDKTAFILPLQTASPTDARMLSVSTREQLTFVGAANMDAVRHSPAFATVERRCSELVRAYMNSIHVLVAAPDVDALARGSQLLRDTQNLRYDESPTAHHSNDDEVGMIYDEIDDIYRYVRQGGEPPCPRSQPTAVQTAADTSADMDQQQSVAATHVGGDHNAADYNWEEPIYEDIEKIRQRKRQRATITETTTEETTTTTNTTTTTTTTVDDQEKQTSVDVMPVGNLRQLIKRFSMLESSTSSKPRPRRDRAPPVPPKLTFDIDATSSDGQTDAKQVDMSTSQPSVGEYVDDSVSLEAQDDVRQDTSPLSAEHLVDTAPPPIFPTDADDTHSTTGCVTSVLVSRDENHHRQQNATSPYYCSRVSVIGGVSSVQPVVVDTHATVTRITTLGRQAARRHDVH